MKRGRKWYQCSLKDFHYMAHIVWVIRNIYLEDITNRFETIIAQVNSFQFRFILEKWIFNGIDFIVWQESNLEGWVCVEQIAREWFNLKDKIIKGSLLMTH